MSSKKTSAAKQEFCKVQQQIAIDESHAQNEIVESASIEDLMASKKFIVKYRDDVVTPQGLGPSGNTIREFKVTGMTVRGLTDSMDTLELDTDDASKEELLKDIMSNPDVEYVEPDYVIHGDEGLDNEDEISENASLIAQQWFHNALNSTAAWKFTLGSNDVVVAVIDSGIDYLHPDLKSNIWRNPGEISGNGKDDDGNGYVDDVMGWNFVNDNGYPRTNSGSHHGTHVAGIIGAHTTGAGVLGVAQNVKLMPLKFLGSGGVGNSSDAIRAINYAISKKVFAINNSWGSTRYSKAMADVVAKAEKAGILFVVSAGNNGSNNDYTKWYPASYPSANVVSVASTNSSGRLSSFSNYGIKTVHVAAPGERILSTITDGKYKIMSGTSMAAPVVSGVAVLAKSMNPNLNYREIKTLLMQAGEKKSALTTKVISGRILNSLKAVTMAESLRLGDDIPSCGPLL